MSKNNSPLNNQGNKINAELLKSLREQIENVQGEICFLCVEMKEKNTLLKMIIHSKGPPQEITLSSPIYRQYHSNNASEKTSFHKQNMAESPQKQRSKIIEQRSKIITQI